MTTGEAMNAVREGRPAGEILVVATDTMVDGVTAEMNIEKTGAVVLHPAFRCARLSLKGLQHLVWSRLQTILHLRRQKKASREARPMEIQMNPLERELERRRHGGQRRRQVKEEYVEIDGAAHSKVTFSDGSIEYYAGR